MSPFAEPSPQRARLGAALRVLRDAAGLTGIQLAERLGISQSSVSRLETGQQIPSIPEARAWAHALGADAEAAGELAELVEAAATEAVAFRRTRARRGVIARALAIARM